MKVNSLFGSMEEKQRYKEKPLIWGTCDPYPAAAASFKGGGEEQESVCC